MRRRTARPPTAACRCGALGGGARRSPSHASSRTVSHSQQYPFIHTHMPLPSSSHYASSDAPSTMHIHTVDIERTASTPEMSHCCAHVSINPQLFALAPEHSSTAHLVCLCSSSQSTAPLLLCLSLLLGACCCACLCLSLPLSRVSYLSRCTLVPPSAPLQRHAPGAQTLTSPSALYLVPSILFWSPTSSLTACALP